MAGRKVHRYIDREKGVKKSVDERKLGGNGEKMA